MAVLNVAGIIASRGFRVLIIDMDLEAPGISYLANAATAVGDRSQPGFVDILLDVVERGDEADLFQLPANKVLARYCAPYELPPEFQSVGASLHIMPAGSLDGAYAGRLERLDLPSLYRGGDGLALVKAFKQAVQESGNFDYVFIDSRTGFSDESGICTRDLADYLMIVSGLNKQNVEGTTHFLAALRAATPDTRLLQMILSPVPNGEDALVDERERVARAAWEAAWKGPLNTDLHIPYHPQLALTEEPHIFRRRRGYLFEAYNQIERRLMSMLGDTVASALQAASTKLKDKDYSAVVAMLERASRLANGAGWIDPFGLALAGSPLPAVSSARPIYDLVLKHASRLLLEHFAWRAVEQAIDMKERPEDWDGADALFKLALEAAPNLAPNLGNYANFLWEKRKDLDAAEALYQRALAADPNLAHNLCNYARFLWRERKDLDAAEALYQRALAADPNLAYNLGHYAKFLWEERKDMDAAEALYQRALTADPNHAHNLGHYANFLWEERRDLDTAEALYQRALAADPNLAHNLGNYAIFLWRERKDLDAAEALYKRALAADPNQAHNLGNYATFLSEGRKDLDAAEALYKRALAADPNQAHNLGNYAKFLWRERKDLDAAEALYQRALAADPNLSHYLGHYAHFLWEERRDLDAAETLYQRALAADPNHANNLSNYATFLWEGRKDLDAAEALYQRALAADPNHANNLGNYATFLSERRKDLDAAEALYQRALAADPNHANNLGNYARLCLSSGRLVEGMELVRRALNLLTSAAPSAVHAECEMYAYCCGDRPDDALASLRRLILTDNIRTGAWDFSGVIQQARQMNHPEQAFLPLLAEVLAGTQLAAALEGWPVWRTCSPDPV
jgi:Tfp pilus assembly protein PilF/cellulose biosynthesis protein BcsQ